MHVEYVDGHCLIDGAAATLQQVESLQAQMTHHILSRQPILTGIAVAAVTVACAGYVRKLFSLVISRRAGAKPFGEKLRESMERHKAHPVRYGLMLGSVVGLLVAAGIAYVGMDADKRASERSLATLQFCHLALRSADEQHALAEQRDHLASIQASEHDIRALVDRLPPAEQAKAREIAGQLATSLGRERELVSQFAEHADATAQAVASHQTEVARGLSKLDGEVGDLQALPASVAKVADDLHAMGKRADTLDGSLTACTTRLDSVDRSLEAITQQLDALANKPAQACPVCAAPVTTTAAVHGGGSGSGSGSGIGSGIGSGSGTGSGSGSGSAHA